ncbi:MAG: endonuclease/exonuclease/phosphatase family protein, partial [Dokdonella sp.]
DVAWSSTTRLFRKLSGLLDPRVGRGMFNTFHADWWFMRWPLDHLFLSSHFTLKQLRRLPSIGSDHFPLLTVLQFTPKRGAAQKGLDADADDHARAKAKQAQQDVNSNDVLEPVEEA